MTALISAVPPPLYPSFRHVIWQCSTPTRLGLVSCFAHWDGSKCDAGGGLRDWAFPASVSAMAMRGHTGLARQKVSHEELGRVAQSMSQGHGVPAGSQATPRHGSEHSQRHRSCLADPAGPQS